MTEIFSEVEKERNHIKSLQDQHGDKPCDHQQLREEKYAGMGTFDYYCTICGTIKSKNEWIDSKHEKFL